MPNRNQKDRPQPKGQHMEHRPCGRCKSYKITQFSSSALNIIVCICVFSCCKELYLHKNTMHSERHALKVKTKRKEVTPGRCNDMSPCHRRQKKTKQEAKPKQNNKNGKQNFVLDLLILFHRILCLL